MDIEQISADVPDWSRERPRQFWDPGRKLLLTVRRYQFWRARGGVFGGLCCKVIALRHRFWSVVTGAEIPLTCQIGGGLLVPHPNGIVIHPDARIGVNCLIFHQVTLGSRGRGGVPEIAGHVDIGAGAKILGPVRIGAHARIGANAVVMGDVAAHGVATGIHHARQSGLRAGRFVVSQRADRGNWVFRVGFGTGLFAHKLSIYELHP